MTSSLYKEDILKDKFEQMTIPLKDDYEGRVVATLIRRLSEPESQKAVLYIHGFNDYFFQTEMAHQFNEHGFNFYALDLRKYGRSYLPHQKFNDIRNLKDYYEEILEALKVIYSEENKEVILFGHSTGGLILTLFAKDYSKSNLYGGLILNSPFYDFNLNKIVKYCLPLVSFLGSLFTKMTISGGFTEEYGKSIHKSFFGEWDYDLKWKPNVAPKINLGWLRAIHKAQKELRKPFNISKPALVIHSEKSATDTNDRLQIQSMDAILKIKDIGRIAGNIKGNVETVAIKGGLHDLTLSQKYVRQNVYSTIFSWIGKNRL